MTHNVIAIRHVEREAQIDRMLSIIKMRDSDYDRGIRELQITDHGIVLSKRPHPIRGAESKAAVAESNHQLKRRHR